MVSVEPLGEEADSGLLNSARDLFRRYGDFLRASGGHKTFRFDYLEDEILELPAPYSFHNGELLIAHYGAEIAGCVAFRRYPGLDDPRCCEIKRLFVVPEFRGHSIGKHLIRDALRRARTMGYRLARLDTDPVSMPSAHQLYLNEGFLEYHPCNPVGETALVFLQKLLV